MIRLIHSNVASIRVAKISTTASRRDSGASFSLSSRQYYNDALSPIQTHDRRRLREKYSRQERSLPFENINDEKTLVRCLKSPIFQQNWFVEDDINEGSVSEKRTEVDKEMARIKTLRKNKFTGSTELLSWKLNCPTSLSYPIDKLASSESTTKLGKIKKYYSYLKSILSLYKHGMVNLYTNHKLSKELFNRLGLKSMKGGKSTKIEYITLEILHKDFYRRARMRRERELEIAKQGSSRVVDNDNNNAGTSPQPPINIVPVNVQIPVSSLTRSEYNLILRTAHDIGKLPLFAAIFCLCFEFTPLVMRVFASLNPKICLTPGQALDDHKRRNAEIHQLKKMATLNNNTNGENDQLSKRLTRTAYNLSKAETRQLARVLNVVSRSIPTRFYPDWILHDRIEDKFKQIKADDVLIGLYGGVWNLNQSELRLACLDRGIALTLSQGGEVVDTTKTPGSEALLNKTEEQLRTELFYWITNLSKGQYNVGFMFHDLAVRDVETAEIFCYLNEYYSVGIHRLGRRGGRDRW